MRKFALIVILLIAFTTMLGEVPYWYLVDYTTQANTSIMPWWDSGYKTAITRDWYLYEIIQCIERISFWTAFTLVANKLSQLLFRVGLIYICYCTSQLIFYLYDRNTNAFNDYLVYILMAAIIVVIFTPEHEMTKLKSLV